MFKSYLNTDEYNLMDEIIDSTNKSYVNETVENIKCHCLRKDIKRSKEIEKLPFYKHGKGLPIGNMTSQFLAIYYLNGLDHYIIHELHLKHMIHFMDDYIIFSTDKDYLKSALSKIESYLRDKLKLELNKNKCMIVNIKDGFAFCGYLFRVIDKKTVMTILNSTKKRVKKQIKKNRYLYNHDMIKFNTVFSSINTYRNGFKYGSRKSIKGLIDRYFFNVKD